MKSHFSLAPPRLLSPKKVCVANFFGDPIVFFARQTFFGGPLCFLRGKLFSGGPSCFHRGTHLSFLCLTKVVANDTGHALTWMRGDRIIGNKTRASIARLLKSTNLFFSLFTFLSSLRCKEYITGPPKCFASQNILGRGRTVE